MYAHTLSHPGHASGQTMLWVRVWPNGESGLLQVDKHQLIRSCGVQARDLHMLESQMMRQVRFAARTVWG